MIIAEDLPIWAALLVSLLLLLGTGLSLTGSLGLLRLGSFYQRVHAPTLGATLGAGCVLFASMIFFSVLQTRPFVTVTTPVTLMVLVRAAVHRDRSEGNLDEPDNSEASNRFGR
jgi:multicomponent K+:H+ antiporter subunit G